MPRQAGPRSRNIIGRIARFLSLTLLLVLVACQREAGGNDGGAVGRVDAADHDAFWLWAGVRPQPVLDDARTIYILQGEVRGRPAHIVSQRPATPRVGHAELWIVYRVETIIWTDAIMPQILAHLERWRAAGNDVRGVQIDFDAATRGLGGYAAFLKQVRAQLPKGTALSVTGLLDWSSRADDPSGLNALAGVVDEVVLQTYQGRTTIKGYEAYLAHLDRLKIPFKIGLVQHGEWTEPAGLKTHPYYRGDVVFLLNSAS